MAVEKQKLNTLNKLIDNGINTEKKISALGIQEIINVPKITVAEIHIITEIQDAIKSKSVISYLASADDGVATEPEKEKSVETEAVDEQEETESEVSGNGRFHF